MTFLRQKVGKYTKISKFWSHFICYLATFLNKNWQVAFIRDGAIIRINTVFEIKLFQFWQNNNGSQTEKAFLLKHNAKTNIMACASSEDSDQPGHPSVWSESSLCTQWVHVAEDPRFLQADSKDFDQTGRMPRLIWVFAGRTCHFVGFVMRWLKICM